jgi:hypothetical protein
VFKFKKLAPIIPASGEYIMTCSIHRIGFFFMLITFLTLPVYSIACQKGDKKKANQVKMPSREYSLDGILFFVRRWKYEVGESELKSYGCVSNELRESRVACFVFRKPSNGTRNTLQIARSTEMKRTQIIFINVPDTELR